MLRVTVIIPTYNRADMITRSVDSVLRQTYTDFELLIADDASTDNTEDVIRGVGDERIRFIRLERNSGSSSRPRNEAIRQAAGDYIALLDSDDEWYPETLEKLVAKMESSPPGVGVIYGGIVLAHADGNNQLYHPKVKGILWPDMLGGSIGSVSASLIRKECFTTVGYFDEGKIIPHWDMWIRLAKAYEYDYVPEILATCYVHDAQFTNRRLFSNMKAVLEKYSSDYRQYAKERRRARYETGYFARGDGNLRAYIVYCLPYLVMHERRWKEFVRFIAVLISPNASPILAKLNRRFMRK